MNNPTSFVIDPPATVSAAVEGMSSRFPVRRIFCVGRNYADHAREMGADPEREAPFFFCKPADALNDGRDPLPYPGRTHNFHHEVELVVALARGGECLSVTDASACLFGAAVGIDWTRRDLQNESKKAGRPWDTAKAFDRAATLGPIRRDFRIPSSGRLSGEIWLSVNGTRRQQGDLSELIWTVPEIIAELSTLFRLCPGDLIYTGTPAGVGAVRHGDRIEAGISSLGSISVAIAEGSSPC